MGLCFLPRSPTSSDPTLMMSSLSDSHSTRAETSRTRPVTSMAMTLTGMATVRPVRMAVLMISVSYMEETGKRLCFLSFSLPEQVHGGQGSWLLPLLRGMFFSRGQWHVCAEIGFHPASGPSSDGLLPWTAAVASGSPHCTASRYLYQSLTSSLQHQPASWGYDSNTQPAPLVIPGVQ